MSAKSEFEDMRDERRDPEELQREADAIRADLDRTLNALERKLSPKRLLDRSLNYMQENSGDILQKIGATVSKHPVPLLVASAGLIWLAAASRQSRSKSWRDRPSVAPRSGDFDTSSQSFGGSSRAQRTAARLKQRATQTFDRTRDRTADLGRSLNDIIQEQPLVSGAVALAVGAIVGSAFPATQFERELVARTRDATESLVDEIQTEGEATLSSAPPISH